MLTSLLDPSQVTRLDLPHGCFNAGLVEDPVHGGYICVYRPDERSFTACRLTNDLRVIPGTQRPLGITNCADPRLIWWKRQLLMVYSSHDTGTFKNECIRAAVLAEHYAGVGPSLMWKPPEPLRVRVAVAFLDLLRAQVEPPVAVAHDSSSPCVGCRPIHLLVDSHTCRCSPVS